MRKYIAILLTCSAWLYSGAQSNGIHRPVNTIAHKLDSLKNLFSGINYQVQRNVANRVLLHNSNAARINDACGYFCTPLILPVTGVQLQGLRINETSVQLGWKTLTEASTSGFVIERSLGTPNEFKRCGWQLSVGNSTTERRYTTLDANDYAGITYYRLQQQDKDGSTAYSNVIAVQGYSASAGILISPNPGTQATTQLLLQGFRTNEPVTLLFADASGRIVVNTKFTVLAAQTLVPLSTLPTLTSGFYAITATNTTQKVATSCVLLP